MPSTGFKTLRTVFRARSGRRFTDPETSRRELEAFVRILPEPEPFRAEPAIVGGVRCEWIHAEEGSPATSDRGAGRTLVFFHGGGYVSGSLASHRALAARLALAAGARVLQVDYRRAPEHPFPAAFDDARAVLAAVLDGRADAPGSTTLAESVGLPLNAGRVGVVGDSAGGGLALAAVAALTSTGARGASSAEAPGILRPGALVCLSPWTDLACTGESLETRAAADPLFDRRTLEEMAGLFAQGADLSDPRLSPLHSDLADLRHLPPTLIQVGDAEVLLSDATRLAERLKAVDVPVEVEIWPEMVHGWQMFAGMVPEGDEAIARIGRFLRDALGPDDGIHGTPEPRTTPSTPREASEP